MHATQRTRTCAAPARRPRWRGLLACGLLLPATALALPATAQPHAPAGSYGSTAVGAGAEHLVLDLRGARPESVYTVDDAVAVMAGSPDGPILPGHENADGIGPGSGLLVGGSGLCTAAYLLKSEVDGGYYLSTAGHCLMTDEEHAGPIDGTSPVAVQTVEICFRGCRFNWAAGVDEFLGLRGDYVLLPQPVAFAQQLSTDGQEDVGYDFGLIRIPAEAVPLLRPWLPQWGGPTGIEPAGLGFADTAVHFGHGTYCCPAVGGVLTRSELDQGRVAQFNYGDEILFEALVGWASGGDSGSPVGRGNPERLESKGVLGDTAVGVLTHGLPNGSFFGTVYQQGLSLASSFVPGLRLVTEDEPITAVQNQNRAPDAADDTAATRRSQPTPIAVLSNDSDADGDPLRVVSLTQPEHGQVRINDDGTVTYQARGGYTGQDRFRYTVDDGRGGTDSAEVLVDVQQPGNGRGGG